MKCSKTKNFYLNSPDKKCANCDSESELHVHHIVPVINGGTHNPSNLVLLCIDCHGKAHSTKITRKALILAGKQKARENNENWKEGRPKKFTQDQIDYALSLVETHSYKQIREITGISQSTLSRVKKTVMG